MSSVLLGDTWGWGVGLLGHVSLCSTFFFTVFQAAIPFCIPIMLFTLKSLQTAFPAITPLKRLSASPLTSLWLSPVVTLGVARAPLGAWPPEHDLLVFSAPSCPLCFPGLVPLLDLPSGCLLCPLFHQLFYFCNKKMRKVPRNFCCSCIHTSQKLEQPGVLQWDSGLQTAPTPRTAAHR